jgi:hypothetical protein
MAKSLAERLAKCPAERTTRKGPPPLCEIYGPGDGDLLAEIHRRKSEFGESWADIQRHLDGLLGIDKPIKNDRFRYHFTRKCDHW